MLLQKGYTPGFGSQMKKCLPSSISNLFKATPSSEGTKYDLSSFILFTTMVMPLGLVGTDLTSDVSVLAQMWHQYVLPFMENGFKAESTNSTVQQEEWNTMPQKEWTLVFMCFLSMGVLLCSTVSLFKTNQLATLVRGVRTQVLMNSWQSEQQDEPIPLGNLFEATFFIHVFISPDHLTRHNMSVVESLEESAWQFCCQWLFYLLLVSDTVRHQGTAAATDLTFWSLLPSSIVSLLSLSMGQYKVLVLDITWFKLFQAHFLTYEFSSSLLQKCVYFLACVGKFCSTLNLISLFVLSSASTISIQLLFTSLILAFLDLPYVGPIIFYLTAMLLPFALNSLRCTRIRPRLIGSNLCHSSNLCFSKPVPASSQNWAIVQLRKFASSNALFVQTFQLQSSKVSKWSMFYHYN